MLKEKLVSIPKKPGVYLLKDASGEVIYVGKAINLQNRVRSYFHTSSDHSPKMRRLVEEVAELDFIVTSSEVEALILECELIKRHKPKYNVRLKDDKRYPYIKITLQEDYPRISTTRRMEMDGARYFGPFTASWAVHQTLDTLRKIFPYITCNRKITGEEKRACLYYHIGRCAGPCIGAISKEDYRKIIEGVCLFLEGKTDEILNDLRARMKEAAERLEYERAAVLRDRIRAIERVMVRQRVASTTPINQDILAFAREDGRACVQVFFIRGGKLIGREYFILTGTRGEEEGEIIASFVKQFYDEAAYIPPEIILPKEIKEAKVIRDWLKDEREVEAVLRTPLNDGEDELLQMASENAAEALISLRSRRPTKEALIELGEYLGLTKAPNRIEGYDISQIHGRAATGSMVVFIKGMPSKSNYKRFRIKEVEGADDYAMIKEVLRRRFKRAIEGDEAWTTLPDLILIDGGKGQLGAALEVLAEYGLEDIPLVSLAKERDEVFAPGRSEPVFFPSDSQALFLLKRIRDEAHRFTLAYHRKLREKESFSSKLEEIEGVGPKRRKALMKRFGSLEAIKEASVEELAQVPGMSRKVAERVKEFL
jgi:excinuclease ABC subunit C